MSVTLKPPAGESAPHRLSLTAGRELLVRVCRVSAALGGLYVLLILLLAIPFVQTHVLYLHGIRFPFFAQFDIPERYGLAPGKAVNLHIHTADNVTLGAWFIFSDPYYLSMPFASDLDSRKEHISSAVKARPTILFFHGNGASRATPLRVNTYLGFTSRVGANVFAIDYRGFGDSTGNPSEEGLACDARAAWDWLIESGAEPTDIMLVGHSLGTAVATRLAAGLGREGVQPRGLALLAPFLSLRKLLDTYKVFGFVSIGGPMALVPGGSDFITWSLNHRFDSLALMPDLHIPTLIVHAQNDWEVPSTHSEALFNALLEPLLPPLPTPPTSPGEWTTEEWSVFTDKQLKRTSEREKIIRRTSIPHFGYLDEFQTSTADESTVAALWTFQGGHNRVGVMEGVQYIIRKTFHFDVV